jgi:hypothetical protein
MFSRKLILVDRCPPLSASRTCLSQVSIKDLSVFLASKKSELSVLHCENSPPGTSQKSRAPSPCITLQWPSVWKKEFFFKKRNSCRISPYYNLKHHISFQGFFFFNFQSLHLSTSQACPVPPPQ